MVNTYLVEEVSNAKSFINTLYYSPGQESPATAGVINTNVQQHHRQRSKKQNLVSQIT